MNSDVKVYDKDSLIYGSKKRREKTYFINGLEVTRQQYEKACTDYKRKEILFLIESDFDLPALYQSILTEFFESAPAHDLQGTAAVAYGRYKRAFLFFLEY